MDALLLYLLKANAVLVLFAAAYYGLLRRLTFFGLNRAYLLLALGFAAVYPALPMPALLPAVAPAPVAVPVAWVLAMPPARPLAAAPPTALPFTWPALALLFYVGGVLLLLGRLLVQLLALGRLRRATHLATTPGGVSYRQLPTPGDPFSFGRTIYLHAEQHSAAELAVVVAHEQAHVRQAHTFDVLLAHVGTALFWANPAAWLLRRALLDNLEYLADAATLRTGLDRRAYQYCLLQLSHGTAGPALVLPFTFFTLKNRIAMMNTPLSSNGQLARYFLAGPLVVLAALGYSAAHARSISPTHFSVSLPSPARSPGPVVPSTATTLGNTSPPVLSTNRAEVAAPARMVSTPAHLAVPAVVNQAADVAQNFPDPIYYLDGQLITPIQFKALEPSDISTINVLKGEQARQLVGDKSKNGVVIITTNANEGPASVIGLNQRMRGITSVRTEATSSLAGSLPADALYYLDGQPSTMQAVEQLDPKSIATTDVVKDPARIHRIPGLRDSPATSVVLVTTKANADLPAVLALADQADLASSYISRPVGVNVLVPAALAYVTSHYPNARLNEVTEQKKKTTGAVKYQVQLINGKRPFYVYFTPQGEFVGE